MKTTDYGFIGVGRMGAHMARRLLKAGMSLTVYDTSKEATDELAKSGAQVASSALDVANNTEVAFLSLPTPDIVQKVCSGLTAAKKMKIVVDCSTTGPGVARIAHGLHDRQRVRQLDVRALELIQRPPDVVEKRLCGQERFELPLQQLAGQSLRRRRLR